MNKPNFSRVFFAAGVSLLSMACAEGVDPDEFVSDVMNTQLESPVISESDFSTIVNSDGSESVKVTWPLVKGAGGYLVNLKIVDDPANPQVLVADSLVDGRSIIFPKLEDTRYELSVQTQGNPKLNNQSAAAPTVYAYTTLVPAVTIPAGTDIAEFLNANLRPGEPNQAFELEAATEYTWNGEVNFELTPVLLRGDKLRRPTVVFGESGVLMTQAGLQVKNINFDCGQIKATGVITLSPNPDASISTETLGYKADGANQNGFVINDPVMITNCNFKNVKNSLLYGNKKNYSLREFRITECIVQLNNSGDKPVIHLQGGQNGLIKEMMIRNSTFYNLVKNSKAYFIRYSNSSNAQPKKIFGNSDNSSTHVISHCTFAKTFSNKDFANNMPNTNTIKTTVEYCVFYDVFRLYQYIQSQSYMLTPGNTTWGVDGGKPNNNDIGGRKDKKGNPYATLEDPGFTEPFAEFDLAQPKGGVNFRPTGEVAVENRSGDPRWYE